MTHRIVKQLQYTFVRIRSISLQQIDAVTIIRGNDDDDVTPMCYLLETKQLVDADLGNVDEMTMQQSQ